MSFNQYWETIYKESRELNSYIIEYWKEYSYFDDWQFWFSLFLIIGPLILLFFAVDRKRIFEVLFFGFTIHILWAYADIMLGSTSYFVHLYFNIPLLPFALSLTSSVLPVGFLLLYQYCTNHNKNIYLWIVIFSAIFSFLLAPLEMWAGLIDFNYGFNYLHIFLIDVAIAVLAYWLTKFVKSLSSHYD